MSMRESAIRPVPRRRRPIWGIVLMVVVGMAVLFGIGFGISLLVRGNDSPQADAVASASASSSMAALPCETTLITPAEVLPATGKVTINVFNGTKKQGLARDTANVLTARGIKVKKVGNAPGGKVVEGVAEIRYGPKGEKAAHLLEYYFPEATLVPITRKTKVVDVVIGKDFAQVVGEAEVAAALASPSPSASGPGCTPSEAAPSDVVSSVPAVSPSPSAS